MLTNTKIIKIKIKTIFFSLLPLFVLILGCPEINKDELVKLIMTDHNAKIFGMEDIESRINLEEFNNFKNATKNSGFNPIFFTKEDLNKNGKNEYIFLGIKSENKKDHGSIYFYIVEKDEGKLNSEYFFEYKETKFLYLIKDKESLYLAICIECDSLAKIEWKNGRFELNSYL